MPVKNHFERGCSESMGLDGGFHADSSNRVRHELEDSKTKVPYYLFFEPLRDISYRGCDIPTPNIRSVLVPI